MPSSLMVLSSSAICAVVNFSTTSVVFFPEKPAGQSSATLANRAISDASIRSSRVLSDTTGRQELCIEEADYDMAWCSTRALRTRCLMVLSFLQYHIES
jgi:hypothetical protein